MDDIRIFEQKSSANYIANQSKYHISLNTAQVSNQTLVNLPIHIWKVEVL